MKQGFMLIELIIATLIASMIAGVLLTALSQSTRVQASVDNVINTSVRIGVVANQLEKDLMGAFIPVQAEEKEEQKKEQKEPSDKKESKPIEKIFYSTNKDGKFDTLTFVTNNPLVVFVGKDVGVVKPKIVRVQYSLKPEVDKKNSYLLLRQESMELDLEQYKNVREYEVVSGIKNCTMTFTARIEKKDEKADKDAKISYEYKILNDWVSEQKKDADKEKSEFPRIPYSVEIKIALWDNQDKKEKEFTIICHIPVDFTAPKKEEKKLPEQSKKDENKAEITVDKNKQQAHNKQPNGQDIVVFNGIETLSSRLEDLVKIFGQM